MRSLHLLTLILFACFAAPAALAQKSIEEIINQDLINKIDKLNKPKGNDGNCPPDKKQIVNASQKSSAGPETQEVEDVAGNKFSVSVVTPEKANEIFQKEVKQILPYRTCDPSLCGDRAQVLGFELAKQKIETGKVFAKPGYLGSLVPDTEENKNGNLRWKYHVANTILVKNGGKIETWVFDRCLFDKPVPLAEWEKKLQSHPKSNYSKSEMANRYSYDYRFLATTKNQYDQKELLQAQARIR